jgi:putative FmdB family regulatory protein
MPIYEYKCEDCGTKFEKLIRRPTDAEQNACPSCGQKHLHQELSTFAAVASSASKTPQMPACPGGRCMNPSVCGMDN